MADDLMTMGEVARTLSRLEAGIGGINNTLTLMRGEFVPSRTYADRMAEMDRAHADYEARLRVLEAKPTVSPKQLWAGFVSAVGVGAVIAPLIRVFA